MGNGGDVAPPPPHRVHAVARHRGLGLTRTLFFIGVREPLTVRDPREGLRERWLSQTVRGACGA
jgi:hypothetical protein